MKNTDILSNLKIPEIRSPQKFLLQDIKYYFPVKLNIIAQFIKHGFITFGSTQPNILTQSFVNCTKDKNKI